MATEAVYKYLHDTNRPYSANDVMLNLHKQYGKTAVQKALDELTEVGKVREKVYGKQKVYSIVQAEEDKGNDENNSQDGNDIDARIKEVSENLKTVQKELKNVESQVQELVSQPTTEEAKLEEASRRERVEKLRNKLKELSENSGVAISSEEKMKTEKEREKFVKEYRKRKRICMDVVGAILEGYPKSKKTLLEEAGIETDEEVSMAPLN